MKLKTTSVVRKKDSLDDELLIYKEQFQLIDSFIERQENNNFESNTAYYNELADVSLLMLEIVAQSQIKARNDRNDASKGELSNSHKILIKITKEINLRNSRIKKLSKNRISIKL